jgi:hypothetical protein
LLANCGSISSDSNEQSLETELFRLENKAFAFKTLWEVGGRDP